jgi:hypothetical protein
MLQGTSAGDQLDNENHDRDDQKQVNEPAKGVGTNQTEQPENQQNHEDCPKHINLSLEIIINSSLGHVK